MQARWLQRASSPGRKVSQSKTAHPAHRERRGSSRTAKCHDLFSDIKHFTGISEQLTASTIVHLLNEYFGAVAKVIHGHRGIVDKYIGDAVMAFWVPPFLAGDDRARDACAAALAQQEAIVALQTRLPEITSMRRNAPELVVRMGIATGEAVVGTIGSESAGSYTVIGDSVNLASRLEGVNKVYEDLSVGSAGHRSARGGCDHGSPARWRRFASTD